MIDRYQRIEIKYQDPVPCNWRLKSVVREYQSCMDLDRFQKERKMFNRRLSRARRVIECAFGLLANKWRIFHRAIDVDFVDQIIKACCVLHNFVRRDIIRKTRLHAHYGMRSSGTKADRTAVFTRDSFSVYFNSAQAYLPWLADLV